MKTAFNCIAILIIISVLIIVGRIVYNSTDKKPEIEIQTVCMNCTEGIDISNTMATYIKLRIQTSCANCKITENECIINDKKFKIGSVFN